MIASRAPEDLAMERARFGRIAVFAGIRLVAVVAVGIIGDEFIPRTPAGVFGLFTAVIVIGAVGVLPGYWPRIVALTRCAGRGTRLGESGRTLEGMIGSPYDGTVLRIDPHGDLVVVSWTSSGHRFLTLDTTTAVFAAQNVISINVFGPGQPTILRVVVRGRRYPIYVGCRKRISALAPMIPNWDENPWQSPH